MSSILSSADSPRLVAITGGIGSGKSVVCRMLVALGYPVYDCDSRAKYLMDNDDEIKHRIACEIGEECIDESNCIVRPMLARRVFSDSALLSILNDITHSAVRADLASWLLEQDAPAAFVETAILYESRLDRMVSEVWDVVAPETLRVQRVMARNAMTAEQVQARIASQSAHNVTIPHPHISLIHNDGITPILPRLHTLLAAL